LAAVSSWEAPTEAAAAKSAIEERCIVWDIKRMLSSNERLGSLDSRWFSDRQIFSAEKEGLGRRRAIDGRGAPFMRAIAAQPRSPLLRRILAIIIIINGREGGGE
jgi:hypothetical protein